MVRGEAKEVNLIPRAFHRREFESPRLSTVSEFIVVAVGSGCPIRQPVASGVPDRVFDGLGRGGELHDFVPPPPPPPPEHIRRFTRLAEPLPPLEEESVVDAAQLVFQRVRAKERKGTELYLSV